MVAVFYTRRLDVPPVRVSTVGKRAFRVPGASVWNDLPLHVASALSLSVFRQRLKTFLFSRFLPRHYDSCVTITIHHYCLTPVVLAITNIIQATLICLWWWWWWWWWWWGLTAADPFQLFLHCSALPYGTSISSIRWIVSKSIFFFFSWVLLSLAHFSGPSSTAYSCDYLYILFHSNSAEGYSIHM